MVRLVNSGTEATMSAMRLARGFTGRDLTVKFEGCYHGHVDSLLVKAGSGLADARHRRYRRGAGGIRRDDDRCSLQFDRGGGAGYSQLTAKKSPR